MKKFLKENWFVLVIVVFFVAISIYFTYDQHKDDLPGKTVDGKDVVFTIDGKDYTADEIYSGLYEENGKSILANIFMNAILDQCVPTTSEIESYVENLVSYYSSQYSYYGGLSYLNNLAQYWGYSDFNEYMTYNYKSNLMCSDYIAEHADQYFTDEFVSKYNPRTVSYCVISFEDAKNPTADDLTRIEKAKAAWASGEYTAETFGDFAKNYTEDSNASNNGKYGYIDSETDGIDEVFLATSLALEPGQVSEWVFSEKFGWFLIKCDSKELTEFKEDSNFVSRVLEHYENLTNEILWAKANELGIEIKDEAVREFILGELNVEESEAK